MTEERYVSPRQCALLLCDVWDQHWCRGAQDRLEEMLPRLSEVVASCRSAGMAIIHSPSGTMGYYEGHPGRLRATTLPQTRLLPDAPAMAPALPIDDSDGGCDTGESQPRHVWTRQHPDIAIQAGDYVTDLGEEVLAILDHAAAELLVYGGVHANMCVLNRPFGIKRMSAAGVPTALLRDLTDTMYDPLRAPYVAHDQGTRLVINYIESFWSPTVGSDELLRALRCRHED